jgi:hypothetical protein
MRSRRTLAPISFRGCQIETPAQRWGVRIARVIVALAGCLFFLVAVMVIQSGVQEDSLGLAAGGVVIALASLALIWAAFTSNGRDVCAAAILFLSSRL